MVERPRPKAKPRGRPFAKGQTGNPRGRPKENEDVRAAAREYTTEAIVRLAVWMRSDDARASVAAANALLDRGWGKPHLSADLNVGGNVTLETLVASARRIIDGEAVEVHEGKALEFAPTNGSRNAGVA